MDPDGLLSSDECDPSSSVPSRGTRGRRGLGRCRSLVAIRLSSSRAATTRRSLAGSSTLSQRCAPVLVGTASRCFGLGALVVPLRLRVRMLSLGDDSVRQVDAVGRQSCRFGDGTRRAVSRAAQGPPTRREQEHRRHAGCDQAHRRVAPLPIRQEHEQHDRSEHRQQPAPPTHERQEHRVEHDTRQGPRFGARAIAWDQHAVDGKQRKVAQADEGRLHMTQARHPQPSGRVFHAWRHELYVRGIDVHGCDGSTHAGPPTDPAAARCDGGLESAWVRAGQSGSGIGSGGNRSRGRTCSVICDACNASP